MCNIRWYHIALTIAALILVFVFFYTIRSVLPPFFIAFLIAWLLDPLIDRLEAQKCPRILAVAFVFTIFLAIFAAGMIFLIPAVIDQAKELAKDFPGYLDKSKDYLSGMMDTYRPMLLRFKLPTTFQDLLSTYGDNLNIWSTNVIRAITGWVTSNFSKALWIILVPLISFYCLNDIDRIRMKTSLLVPERWRLRTTHVVARMNNVFSSYVRGLLLVCLIYGVVTSLVLTILGIQYSILIGLFAGILYAVPYVGATSTAVLVFLVALATHNENSLHAIWVSPVAMLILNQAFDMFISPKVLGKSVGLHPVLSLFALLAGGQLFGLAGMILAVPIAASIQEIIFEIYPLLRKSPEQLLAIKQEEAKKAEYIETGNSILDQDAKNTP
ncbi:MAG: AI-2E family transporter [Armatimonadota bacterium]